MFVKNSQFHLEKYVLEKRAFVCLKTSKHSHIWIFTKVIHADNLIYNTITKMYHATDIKFRLKNKIKDIKKSLIGFVMYE